MKKFTIILALFSFLATLAQSDPSWIKKQDLGFNLSARAEASMVSEGNNLYILGGYDGCGPKNFIRYNTQTGEVTQLKNLLSGCPNVTRAVMFTLGTKIYSFTTNGNYVYDITIDTWANLPSIGLNPDAGFIIGTTIYITSQTYNDFYAFDTLNNTFTQKANYPENPSRRGAMSFDIDGKGYLVGGTIASTNGCTYEIGCFTNTVFEYNPTTDVWATKTGMPKAIVFGSAISHNGKGYAGLGETYEGSPASNRVKTSSWYEYNPTTDTWIAMQNYMNLSSNNYNNTVSETAITKINDEIYIFGGVGGGVHNIYKDDITKYNTTTNTWTSVNTDPGKNRTEAAGFYSNGKIYVGGGHDSEQLTDFWEYTIATDSWLQKANLPSSHTQRACVELNGKGYFIGGYGKSIPYNANNPNANYLETLTEYDPALNTFTEKAPYPIKRSGMSVMTYDGKIYAGFGSNYSGTLFLGFYMYNPQTNTWTAKASAPFTGANLSCFVLGNVGYVLSINPSAMLIGKYNFLTDTWSTSPLNLNTVNNIEYSNQSFVFDNNAYLVHGNYNTVDGIFKFNPIDDTWSHVTNVPFKERGNSIISTPSEVYFAFGDRDVHSESGFLNSNTLTSLRFGAAVSVAIGLYSSKTAFVFNAQASCGTGILTNGAKHAINDVVGDLFIAVEATTSTIPNTCMEVSSTALTTPFQTATANYGGGFTENAMFLNKNLLLDYFNTISIDGIVRLYFTQAELQKLVADFNTTYTLNKSIADIKIVRYFDNASVSDHDITNNNAVNGYSLLTATLNTYGADYYFRINTNNSTNSVRGEIRAALLTGQNLGIKDLTISKIRLYPNPTNSILNIETDKHINKIRIVDVTGRLTAAKNLSNTTIDVSDLSSGVYLIEVKTDDGLFREKFIKI